MPLQHINFYNSSGSHPNVESFIIVNQFHAASQFGVAHALFNLFVVWLAQDYFIVQNNFLCVKHASGDQILLLEIYVLVVNQFKDIFQKTKIGIIEIKNFTARTIRQLLPST